MSKKVAEKVNILSNYPILKYLNELNDNLSNFICTDFRVNSLKSINIEEKEVEVENIPKK